MGNGHVCNHVEGLYNSSRISESAQLRLNGLYQISLSSLQRVLQFFEFGQILLP